jgi:hypothetical protein
MLAAVTAQTSSAGMMPPAKAGEESALRILFKIGFLVLD